MRKLNIQVKDQNPEGPHIDVMECPICGRFRESVDIDFKRWRYCHKVTGQRSAMRLGGARC